MCVVQKSLRTTFFICSLCKIRLAYCYFLGYFSVVAMLCCLWSWFMFAVQFALPIGDFSRRRFRRLPPTVDNSVIFFSCRSGDVRSSLRSRTLEWRRKWTRPGWKYPVAFSANQAHNATRVSTVRAGRSSIKRTCPLLFDNTRQRRKTIDSRSGTIGWKKFLSVFDIEQWSCGQSWIVAYELGLLSVACV